VEVFLLKAKRKRDPDGHILFSNMTLKKGKIVPFFWRTGALGERDSLPYLSGEKKRKGAQQKEKD